MMEAKQKVKQFGALLAGVGRQVESKENNDDENECFVFQ